MPQTNKEKLLSEELCSLRNHCQEMVDYIQKQQGVVAGFSADGLYENLREFAWKTFETVEEQRAPTGSAYWMEHACGYPKQPSIDTYFNKLESGRVLSRYWDRANTEKRRPKLDELLESTQNILDKFTHLGPSSSLRYRDMLAKDFMLARLENKWEMLCERWNQADSTGASDAVYTEVRQLAVNMLDAARNNEKPPSDQAVLDCLNKEYAAVSINPDPQVNEGFARRRKNEIVSEVKKLVRQSTDKGRGR